jgi:hypothetical protein
MDVWDARRPKGLELENTRLKKLLADALLENEVTKEALRKKWCPHRFVGSSCGGYRQRGCLSGAVWP